MDNIETTKNKAEEKKPHKLFNYCMCNPPYQEDKRKDSDNANFAAPVYHEYMEAMYNVSEVTEMITPARFLFNAGATPKKWNEKRLNDEHFKVLKYESDSKKVFPNVGIAGGTAVTIRDDKKDYGATEVFVEYGELDSILDRVRHYDGFAGINSIIRNQTNLDLDALYADHPECKSNIGSDGKDKRLRPNAFVKLSTLFTDIPSEDRTEILGLSNLKRVSKFIKTNYLDTNYGAFDKWKILVSEAAGPGSFGSTLSSVVVCEPFVGHTQTFLSFGAFDTKEDAEACAKYIKTKFARCLLGVLKITQHNPPEVWKYVPLQDFTAQSDIDWSCSIPEIDQQLYAKYGLTEEEIEFIETHVKAMS